jgi:hypothetical protein
LLDAATEIDKQSASLPGSPTAKASWERVQKSLATKKKSLVGKRESKVVGLVSVIYSVRTDAVLETFMNAINANYMHQHDSGMLSKLTIVPLIDATSVHMHSYLLAYRFC